jgi:hypothetical protein
MPLLREPLRFLSSLPACGDLVQIRIGPFRVIIVCDPALTRQVLLDDRSFDKGGMANDKVDSACFPCASVAAVRAGDDGTGRHGR